ncbi:group II intron maturase-specific domain-containing protein [Flavobacterium gawalongense]|uniref:group II intron maturase-specific domain-containing protein n=1 Tax=Flavobacterium gawalongense TaxID=2594432 RepID=UPI003743717C
MIKTIFPLCKVKRSNPQNRTEKFRGTHPKNQRPEPIGEQAKQIQRGWLNYFRGTSIQGKLRDIDGWLRNRLRYCIWTDWKNCSEAKITNTKKQ